MNTCTPAPASISAHKGTTPARRHIYAAAFCAAFERATEPDADSMPPHDLLTLANAAGWRAARRAASEDAGQGAGFANDLVREALADAFICAGDHRRAVALREAA